MIRTCPAEAGPLRAIRLISPDDVKQASFGYQGIRLSGSGYRAIRTSGGPTEGALAFADVLIAGILHPDFLIF